MAMRKRCLLRGATQTLGTRLGASAGCCTEDSAPRQRRQRRISSIPSAVRQASERAIAAGVGVACAAAMAEAARRRGGMPRTLAFALHALLLSQPAASTPTHSPQVSIWLLPLGPLSCPAHPTCWGQAYANTDPLVWLHGLRSSVGAAQ
jgi:hypothetical protein